MAESYPPLAPVDPDSSREEIPVDVAATFARLREAVRQRAAEAATLEPGAEAAQSRLLALRELDTVREPVPVSPRRGLGRLIVFARKAAFHLFLKWLVRPLLAQQNQFNQTASQLIEELVRSEERLRGELRRQAALLARAGIDPAGDSGIDAGAGTPEGTGGARPRGGA